MLHFKKSNGLNRLAFLSWVLAALFSLSILILKDVSNPIIVFICGLANILHFVPGINISILLFAVILIYYI